MNLVEKINEYKIISILRSDNISKDNIIEIVSSLYDAGIRILEITLNSKNALECIELVRNTYPDMVVGAGTVRNMEDASNAISAGSSFILTPNLDKEVIEYCNEKNILVVPGTFSPSEIYNAHKWGAKIIKVFPIGSLGYDYVKNVQGPMNDIKNIMAVGGVNKENAKTFLENGCNSLGIGGSIVNDKLVLEKDYEQIGKNAREIIQAIS